jgi:hypothetical protein
MGELYYHLLALFPPLLGIGLGIRLWHRERHDRVSIVLAVGLILWGIVVIAIPLSAIWRSNKGYLGF